MLFLHITEHLDLFAAQGLALPEQLARAPFNQSRSADMV